MRPSSSLEIVLAFIVKMQGYKIDKYELRMNVRVFKDLFRE